MGRKEEYEFIVSLGAACACSDIIRNCELQEFSYPFDWVYGSSLKERIQLIVNDFKDWFNKEDFQKIGQRLNPEPCDIYENKKTNIVYNHDFDLGITFEQAFSIAQARYKRRTDRMLKNIENSKDILFLYIDLPTQKNPYTFDYLTECISILQKKYPNKNITIKYFYNAEKEFYYTEKTGIEIFADNYKSQKDNSLPDDIDKKIIIKKLSNVKLKRNFTNKIKKFKNFIFSYRINERVNTKKHILTIFGIKFSLKREKHRR